jgi:hypothetical protein
VWFQNTVGDSSSCNKQIRVKIDFSSTYSLKWGCTVIVQSHVVAKAMVCAYLSTHPITSTGVGLLLSRQGGGAAAVSHAMGLLLSRQGGGAAAVSHAKGLLWSRQGGGAAVVSHAKARGGTAARQGVGAWCAR